MNMTIKCKKQNYTYDGYHKDDTIFVFTISPRFHMCSLALSSVVLVKHGWCE